MKDLLGRKTRCLLVQPSFSKFSFWSFTDVCKLVGAKHPAPSLGLVTVAALLPQHWEFRLVDENAEVLRDEHIEWADIVCTGGMLPQQHGILSVIERAHRHGRPVVVGGADPTSQPRVYQASDYLVRGEGETTIPLFLDDLGRGVRSGEYRSDERPDMADAVVPRFDLIRFKDYLQVGIQYSRGCPFNCEFCDIIELYGRKVRSKRPTQIIRELQTLYDLGHRGFIDVVDDNFIGNKRNVKALLPEIKAWSEAHNHPFYFGTEASIDLADDDELLAMMRDVDFRFVFIGIETPDDDILRQAQKKQNVNKSVSEAIRKVYSYGLTVSGGFIIGFDNETERTADHMIECVQSSGICMAMLGMLYALPNTQLTRRLKKEGRLFEEQSLQRDVNTRVDQMSSGLNFVTTRPRLDILKDFVRVTEYLYNPTNYYRRVIQTGLEIRPAWKHKPSIAAKLKIVKAFLKLCMKAGFSRTTGLLYWKLLFTILFRNPKAFESALSLAASFIHFENQSRFIIDLTKKKIEHIERHGEEHYNQCMLRPAKDASHHPLPLASVHNG